MSDLNPIPPGFHRITPFLIVKGASRAIEFYRMALGAEENYRIEMPDGGIAYAELQIGDSRLMMADEYPDYGYLGPGEAPAPVSFMVYVENVDQASEQAVNAGMTVIKPITTQFYGDRTGTFRDPFGHRWTIGSRVEEVSPEEMRKRAEAIHGA